MRYIGSAFIAFALAFGIVGLGGKSIVLLLTALIAALAGVFCMLAELYAQRQKPKETRIIPYTHVVPPTLTAEQVIAVLNQIENNGKPSVPGWFSLAGGEDWDTADGWMFISGAAPLEDDNK